MDRGARAFIEMEQRIAQWQAERTQLPSLVASGESVVASGAAYIARLEAENASLKAEVAALKSKVDDMEYELANVGEDW